MSAEVSGGGICRAWGCVMWTENEGCGKPVLAGVMNRWGQWGGEKY